MRKTEENFEVIKRGTRHESLEKLATNLLSFFLSFAFFRSTNREGRKAKAKESERKKKLKKANSVEFPLHKPSTNPLQTLAVRGGEKSEGKKKLRIPKKKVRRPKKNEQE